MQTTQHRPFSLLQLSNLGIFQLAPPPQYLSTGWVFPGIFQPALPQPRGVFHPDPPHQVSFSYTGISQYISTDPHSEPHFACGPWVGMPWYISTALPLQVSFAWEGTGNLLHHQVKLRISTNMGDTRTRRVLPKFFCTPWGIRWVQEAAGGTNALIPHGVQVKEESPLWVPSSVAITVD